MAVARELVLSILNKMEKDRAYSNITFDRALKAGSLSEQDKAFAAALFYGILERRLLLDHVIGNHLSKPAKKLETNILNILRIGFYQLIYMDSVDDHAAVNETVNLCKMREGKKIGALQKSRGFAGLVNAVLRSFLREGKKIRFPDEKDTAEYYSLFYSCPEWLVKSFIEDYGSKNAQRILEASLGKPPLTLRVNTKKTTAGSLLKAFKNLGIHAEAGHLLTDSLILKGSGSISQSPLFEQGFFHVQDLSSQLCAHIAASCSPHPKAVYDICAAPGGKSFTLAQLFPDKPVYAFDLFPKRTDLIKEGADRLGLPNIIPLVNDWSLYRPDLLKELRALPPDLILCDVPCSGFGVMGKKPEIKYKNKEEIAALPRIQSKILRTAARFLPPGGTLIYSTCTLNKKENEEVAEDFLESNSSFAFGKVPPDLENTLQKFHIRKDGQGMITVIPEPEAYDGFFIAILQRTQGG